MRRTWLALAACLALVLAGGGTAAASVAAPAGDGPPGFWWGTDSFNVSVPGKAPYSMPFLGGAYGGYIGMTGNWAYWLGCSGREHFLAYSTTNAAQAHTNFVTYHKGVGLGAYWFMGGPGVDPHYNGTARPRPARGVRGRRPGRWPTSGEESTTRSSGWTSSCPASGPPPTTAGTACTPRRAAGSRSSTSGESS